jgi:four helix bundle protein
MSSSNVSYPGGDDIRERTFEFACSVVRFCEVLYARGGIGRVMAPQLVKCSTSSAGMMEEARCAESRRDFLSKCAISLKEMRESHVRLRIHERCRIGPANDIVALRTEAGELVAILMTIVKNTRRRLRSSSSILNS